MKFMVEILARRPSLGKFGPYGDIDCSNGGISSKGSHLYVIEQGDPMPDDHPHVDYRFPLAMIVPGNLRGCVKIVPVGPDGKPMRGSMFGGNFAYSSDSRWHAAVEAIAGSRQSGAVPIHDRFE